jgi:hypothetical protein
MYVEEHGIRNNEDRKVVQDALELMKGDIFISAVIFALIDEFI